MIIKNEIFSNLYLRSLSNCKLVEELERAKIRLDENEIKKIRREMAQRGLSLFKQLIMAHKHGNYSEVLMLRRAIDALNFGDAFIVPTLYTVAEALSEKMAPIAELELAHA